MVRVANLSLAWAVLTACFAGQGVRPIRADFPPSLASEELTAARVALLDADPTVRLTAVIKIGQLGPLAAPAVRDLVRLLNDSSARVVNEATQALMLTLSLDDVDALRSLEALARGDALGARIAALDVLGSLRSSDAITARVLTELIEDEDPAIREKAMQGIFPAGSATPASVLALARVIGDSAEEPAARITACAVLTRFHAAGAPAIPALVRALHDPLILTDAARTLGCMRGAAFSAASYVSARWTGRFENREALAQQFAIAMALDRITGRTSLANETIIAGLSHGDLLIREGAAELAGTVDCPSVALVVRLASAMLRDPEPRVCARAAAALGQTHTADTDAVKALITALQIPNVRFEAGVSLGLIVPTLSDGLALVAAGSDVPEIDRAAILFAAARIGNLNHPARRALVASLTDADPLTQFAGLAFFGVLRGAPHEADVALAQGLLHPLPVGRLAAGWCIARTHPKPELPEGASGAEISARGLAPLWLSATTMWSMTPSDDEILTWLCDAHHRLKFGLPPAGLPPPPPPEEVNPDRLPTMAVALADGDARILARVAERAGARGDSTPATLAALGHLLGNPSRRVRLAAANALATLGVDAAPAKLPVIAAISDPCWSVRRASVFALAALAPAGTDTGHALGRAASDPVACVREASRTALMSPISPRRR